MHIVARYILCVVSAPLLLCHGKRRNIHLLLHSCRSILLSLLTVISLATMGKPDPASVDAKNDVPPTLITFLVVTVIFVISYRVFRFLWRKN